MSDSRGGPVSPRGPDAPGGTGPSHGVRSSELSSMAASLDEMVRRVATIAEAAAAGDDRVPRGGRGALAVSQELFEAERALTDAARRLANTAEALREAGRG